MGAADILNGNLIAPPMRDSSDDCARFGESVEPERTKLAADPRLLEPAEWRVRFTRHSINGDAAGFDLSSDTLYPFQIG